MLKKKRKERNLRVETETQGKRVGKLSADDQVEVSTESSSLPPKLKAQAQAQAQWGRGLEETLVRGDRAAVMSAENAMSIHAIIGVQPTIHKIKNKNNDVFVINKNRMVIFKFFLYFWMVKIMMMLLYRENENENGKIIVVGAWRRIIIILVVEATCPVYGHMPIMLFLESLIWCDAYVWLLAIFPSRYPFFLFTFHWPSSPSHHLIYLTVVLIFIIIIKQLLLKVGLIFCIF